MLFAGAILLAAASPAPGATVTGIVKDTSGKPPENVRIDHSGKRAVADAEGKVRVVMDVPAIAVRNPGYESQRVRITGDVQLEITLQRIRSTSRRKLSAPPAFKTKDANGVDYTAKWFYIETKDGPQGIISGSGPMYSWGAPDDRQVWTSVNPAAPTARTPASGLVLATDGNFYGTTYAGGAHNDGTIFQITPEGTLATLHSFASTDGANPAGALVEALDGNFYGTTAYGGAKGYGTVFDVTPKGTLTTLHSFASTDGATPLGSLVQVTFALDSNFGNFYGTTQYGGTAAPCKPPYGEKGCGTIFEITPGGALTTLYSFCSRAGCADGQEPFAGLAPGGGGYFGTTNKGGSFGYGTAFEITTKDTLTTLHSFSATEGCCPLAGLVQASDGFFYGTTDQGQKSSDGAIFAMTNDGIFENLARLTSVSGGNPIGGVVQGTAGNFYGTTGAGGTDNDGTLFSLSTGLDPFVETLPAAGYVGTVVRILGTDLTATTAVSFAYTPAKFTLVSPTEITATVPAGAATGKVQVTAPSGTLLSNGLFQILVK